MYYRLYNFKKPEQTALESFEFKGPVRKVRTISYLANVLNNEILEGELFIENNSHSQFNSDLSFDKKGNLIEEILFGKPGNYCIKTYTEKHQILTQQDYAQGKLTSQLTNTYNDNGVIVKAEKIDADNQPQYTVTYTYNADGKLTERLHINHKIPQSSKLHTTIYNKFGKIESSEDRHPETQEVFSKSHRLYNDDGLELESTYQYFQDYMKASSYRQVNVYNSYNDLIGWDKYDADDNLKESPRFGTSYRYDKDGNRIKETVSNPEEDATFQDKVDKHGNWTWRAVLESGIPQLIMIREIIYDDADFAQPHTLFNAKKTEVEEHRKFRKPDTPPLTDLEINLLKLEFSNNIIELSTPHYFLGKFKTVPSPKFYELTYQVFHLKKFLEEQHGAIEIQTMIGYDNEGITMSAFCLEFPSQPGYVLRAGSIHDVEAQDYIVPPYLTRIDGLIETSKIVLLTPPSHHQYKDIWFEDCIDSLIHKCTLKLRPARPKINIIEVRGSGFVLQRKSISEDFRIDNLDVNYGYGFAGFHQNLMNRFNTSNKGLVLFHGLPGTGKTYYIRHLLKELSESSKVVTYIPPNMVDHLTDPGFMTFINDTFQRLSNQGKHCVLLIEDAEPLLAKRQEGVRIQGVTNLLNMTDGLLNDLLNVQIICTFNVDLKKLDSALLRPGRLLARKEFKPLSELDANLLAQRLGIKHTFTKPATLGTIYSMLANQNTLIHDVDSDEGTSSPIDDL